MAQPQPPPEAGLRESPPLLRGQDLRTTIRYLSVLRRRTRPR